MVSIIICSINPVYLDALTKNIDQTIGLPYQIIAIDNTINRFGICKVYNNGAKQAIYDTLCFVHEDVAFATQNWGNIIIQHLKDEKVGLIGLAGGDAKSSVPSSWSIPVVSNHINIFQHFKDKNKAPKHIVETNIPNTIKQQVVALDGVFLCTRKAIFNKFKFDEHTFKGFHGYDIDYSLQVNTQYQVFVIFDLVLHHFSEGTPDSKWVNSAIALTNKWKKQLPICVFNLSKEDANLYHWRSLQVFLQKLFELKYPLPIIIKNYFKYSFTKYFRFRKFFSMGKYVIVSALNF